MFLILLTVLGFVVSIVFTILFKVSKSKMWYHEFIFKMISSWVASGGVLIISAVVLPCMYCGSKQFVDTFEKQKYYIEEVVPTLPNSDNYAITQSRIELNQQLYDWQYEQEHYSFFFFYPQGIEDLEPIK